MIWKKIYKILKRFCICKRVKINVDDSEIKCKETNDFYYDHHYWDIYLDLCNKGEGNSPEAKDIRKMLKRKGYKVDVYK